MPRNRLGTRLTLNAEPPHVDPPDPGSPFLRVGYGIAKSVTGAGGQAFGNQIDARAFDESRGKGCDQRKPWTVYNQQGQRKYLTRSETRSFLAAARDRDDAVQSFCWMMAVTGCRISEALALSEKSLDFEAKHVIIECLKKRKKGIFRTVPLPVKLLDKLKKLLVTGVLHADRLWPWSRMTGYRRICEVMRAAGVTGSYATPRGLRHGFGVRAIQSNVPLNLVQRWLGHADIKTTAIYTYAMGPEEREIAGRMWIDSGDISKPSGRSKPPSAAVLDKQAIEPTWPAHGDIKSDMDKGKPTQPGAPISAANPLPVFGKLKASCQLLQIWLYCIFDHRSFSLTYFLTGAVRRARTQRPKDRLLRVGRLLSQLGFVRLGDEAQRVRHTNKAGRRNYLRLPVWRGMRINLTASQATVLRLRLGAAGTSRQSSSEGDNQLSTQRRDRI